jgi:hypothetical protein
LGLQCHRGALTSQQVFVPIGFFFWQGTLETFARGGCFWQRAHFVRKLLRCM